MIIFISLRTGGAGARGRRDPEVGGASVEVDDKGLTGIADKSWACPFGLLVLVRQRF